MNYTSSNIASSQSRSLYPDIILVRWHVPSGERLTGILAQRRYLLRYTVIRNGVDGYDWFWFDWQLGADCCLRHRHIGCVTDQLRTLNSGQTLANSSGTGTINGNLNVGSGSLALTYASGTPALQQP